MDPHHKNILRELRKLIVADVDVNNGVLNQLRENSILTDDHVLQIRAGKTNENKAEILLDIIPNCGPQAFEVFHHAVAYNYSWIYDDINKLIETPNLIQPSRRSITVPPISPLTVPREQKMEQLKMALTKLEPGGYVVLHGMKGFGKHSLTASTLKNESLIENLFDNQVYWIKFAYASSDKLIDAEILSQLNSLYHRVTNTATLSLVPESGLSKENIIEKLKHYFSNNKNSLVVLNDVWNPNIIDSFDFGCKTLVITTNVDLLGYSRIREIVEMKDGFTEDESLRLFAKSLKIEVDQLPDEARSIHYECNGMPILIAMFAAQFREYKDDMRANNIRWKYYLKAFRQKDRTNKVIDEFLNKQHAIFDMCINQLTEPIQKMYKQLVIFSEDVNITTTTLTILWDEINPYVVDDNMIEICKKSLAAKQWNIDLDAYIYGVHDLLLCHLQNGMKPEELRNYHRLFIEKYRKYCNNDFSKLPDDNYGYSYIGYHLEQAKMYDEFEKLYLDLNFIQSKIYHCGLNDLLIDINKYKNYIIADKADNKEKLDEWEQFLRSQSRIIAEHRRRKCLDLVQIGINYFSQGYIYDTARKLAQSKSTYLYLTHKPVEEPISYEPPTELCTANFTDNPTQLLIGNNDGNVISWDIEKQTQITYSGHRKSKIIKVILSHMGDFFLALNDDGVIKKFNLKNDDNQENDNDRNLLQSPREKQSFWSGIHRNPKPANVKTYMIQENNFNHIIEDIALSSDDTTIAACTLKGIIQVWNINGDIIFTQYEKKCCFNRITFARETEFLSIVDNNNGVIYIYRKKSSNGEYTYKISYRPEHRLKEIDPKTQQRIIVGITKKKIIYFNEIPNDDSNRIHLIMITNSEALIIMLTEFMNNSGELVSPSARFMAEIDNKSNPNMKYIAGTLTYDGQYFLTSDSEGFVKIWKVNGLEPCTTFTGRVNVLDTYCCVDEGYHLIMGASNHVIHKWTFLTDNPKSLLQSPIKPLFDAVMKPLGESDIVAQVIDKKIGIFIGQKLISQTEPITGEIISLSLSQDADCILYIVKKTIFYNTIYKLLIYHRSDNKTNEIKSLNEYVGFAKFLRIKDMNVAVWRQGNNLGIKLLKIECQANDTGHVIALYTTINDKYVITVANNEKIIIWEVSHANYAEWRNIFTKSGGDDENVTYSEIGPNRDLIAVLNSDGILNIYMIVELDNNKVELNIYTTRDFKKKLTCCSFSPDQKYLAIGMNDGEIVIFDIYHKTVYKDPPLHCNAIRQLCWAPLSVNLPILLSLNCDEIAWWNISLMGDVNKKMNRRSRTGISRSITTPTMGMSPRGSMRLPKSQTMDLGKLTGQLDQLKKYENGQKNGSNNNRVDSHEFWKSKESRDNVRPALLGITQLPQSSLAKVCVSSDFQKFLLVDAHGSINTFEFFY